MLNKTIYKELGTGSMANVYHSANNIGKKVVIKVSKVKHVGDKELFQCKYFEVNQILNIL
jgi:serine/threonine protein kinase